MYKFMAYSQACGTRALWHVHKTLLYVCGIYSMRNMLLDNPSWQQGLSMKTCMLGWNGMPVVQNSKACLVAHALMFIVATARHWRRRHSGGPTDVEGSTELWEWVRMLMFHACIMHARCLHYACLWYAFVMHACCTHACVMHACVMHAVHACVLSHVFLHAVGSCGLHMTNGQTAACFALTWHALSYNEANESMWHSMSRVCGVVLLTAQLSNVPETFCHNSALQHCSASQNTACPL